VSVLAIDTGDGFQYWWSVPRKLRIQYPGAIYYHLMNRGGGPHAG
jgi:hypothetical protein